MFLQLRAMKPRCAQDDTVGIGPWEGGRISTEDLGELRSPGQAGAPAPTKKRAGEGARPDKKEGRRGRPPLQKQRAGEAADPAKYGQAGAPAPTKTEGRAIGVFGARGGVFCRRDCVGWSQRIRRLAVVCSGSGGRRRTC
jgi:hypothetical protein